MARFLPYEGDKDLLVGIDLLNPSPEEAVCFLPINGDDRREQLQ
jgi:hypothetical protein